MNIRNKFAALLALKGWKRYALVAVLGIGAALALPPVFASPLLIPAFSLLFLLFSRIENVRSAFALGWWFGFGYFLAGLYWIPIALTVDIAAFGWMIPFALIGIPAACAVYYGLITLVTYFVPVQGWLKLVTLSLVWGILEYARAQLISGFPWNMIGYVWNATDISIQSGWLFGVYGLNAMTPFFAGALALLLTGKKQDKAVFVIALISFSALMLWGQQRLNEPKADSTRTLKVRMVQASIPQHLKWDPEFARLALQKHIGLSLQPGFEELDAVVWSESAVPFTVQEGSEILKVLAQAAPPHGYLIAGAIRRSFDRSHSYNSVVAINREGRIVQAYDKHHLVPFGEYVPFRSILPIDKIVKAAPGDFSRGNGPQTLELEGMGKVNPLICYEAIFPEYANLKQQSLLVNVTNDAWFGQSSGPYQHLEMSRMRAVEQNKSMIRVANTGISAAFDGKGRILAKLGLMQSGKEDIVIELDN